MIGLLAVSLPIAFALALGARPDFPRSAVAISPPALGDDLFPDLEVAVRPLSGGARLLVDGADSNHPELLLYLSSTPAAGFELPAAAHLLGPGQGLPPRLLDLPPDARGTLLLYSLGHGRVIAQQSWPGETSP